MSVQYKFFTIPVRSIELCEEDMNKFLRSIQVVNMAREFVDMGDNSFWAVAVEYREVENESDK